MKERTYLKNTILLCSESDGQRFKRTFTIVKRLGEGGSMAIGYEAYHGSSSGRGVLREFYPQDSIILERNKDNQLVISGDFEEASNRYFEERNRYVDSYVRLGEIIRSNKDLDLNKFLPVFEIYYGCDEDMNIIGTAYIWTPEPKLKTFDTVCHDIHRFPTKSPEYKLVSVLKALESLTESVMDLHMAGFIHRDIKPSNFGFQMSHNRLLTESFKLFDIDSICRTTQRKFSSSIYSEGFTEPEAISIRPTSQTDIYSIGATLFYGIVVTPETKVRNYLYWDEYYDRIDEFVSNSELIKCSESNSHPRLRHQLSIILKKCLAPRSIRYERCEDLLEDIRKAIYYALPGEVNGGKDSDFKWVLKNELDKVSSKNSSMVFINHLYEVPFYRFSEEKDEEINILIVGLGNYGQKFLDIVLQSGHMVGKKIKITAISSDEVDRQIYLEERPELSNFFNISGISKVNDPYADINFETHDFDGATIAKIKSNTESYISSLNKKFNYTFVALGKDSVNKAVAEGIYAAGTGNGDKVTVCYSVEGQDVVTGNSNKEIYSVPVNMPLSSFKHNEEIERMAFNMHLLWEKNLNLNLKKVRKAYNEVYYHTSSVCAVLSLKYKLYSLGLDLDTLSPYEISKEYFNRINSNEEYVDTLVYLEHKRWVTEKICFGWTKRDIKDAFEGVTRDKKEKNHICIVRSEPNQNLSRNYKDNDLWDTLSEDELSTLDELDRLSVELHRGFVKRASKSYASEVLGSHYYQDIYSIVEKDKISVAAFQEWFLCMKEICSPVKNSRKIHLYESLRDSFLSIVESHFDKAYVERVKTLVTSFDSAFNPIILSYNYRDWKKDDLNIILNTPFILTYTTKNELIIPFGLGDNEAVFGNVASVAVVNPNKVKYLIVVNKKTEVEDIINSLTRITSFMKKKNIMPSIELYVAFNKSIGAIFDRSFERRLIAIDDSLIKSVKRVSFTSEKELTSKLESYIRSKVIKGLTSIERNSSYASDILSKAGIYNEYPEYEFDSSSMLFKNTNGTNGFEFISKKPHFTVSEAMSFNLLVRNNIYQPEFYNDYSLLWNKYCANSSAWKKLNSLLKDYSEANDVVVTLSKKNSDKNTYSYMIPNYCSRAARKVLTELMEKDFISSESKIEGYTSDSCIVSISESNGLKCDFDKLFSNISNFVIDELINVSYDAKSDSVKVIYNNFVVRNMEISSKDSKDLMDLLNFFHEMNYINCLSSSKEGKNISISFTYATAPIKRFLTTNGSILEVYTYHKVKEQSEADDIVSNYEADINKTGELSEFALIITKGFSMVFVECNFDSDLNEEYYEDLKSRVNKLGINSTVVLIGNQGKNNKSDVITIYEENRIQDIGRILMDII